MPRKEIYIKAWAHYRLQIEAAAEEITIYRDTLRRNGLHLRRRRVRNEYMVLDATGQGLTGYMQLEELRAYMRNLSQ